MKLVKILTAIILIIFVYSETKAQRILAETAFEAKSVKSIKIKGKFCDVKVKSGSRNYVEAKIIGSGDADDYSFESATSGDRLLLEVQTPRSSWSSMREAYITVTISSIEELIIDNSSGDVTVEDISADFFDVHATSGNVEVADIKGKRLSLGATSGDLIASDIEGDLNVGSTSGNLELREISGSVSARATSGNIRLRYFEGRVSVETTSGDIMIANGKGLEYLKSTSGDIDGYDLILDTDLTLRSTSGDINLSIMNDFDELSFDLRSNSGDLQAGKYDGEDELYIKRGNIWIKGNTTSGDLEIN